MCDYTKTVNAHCKPAEGQFESLVGPQVKAVMHELLLKWLEKAELDVAPATAATAASWAIYGLALQWSHEKQPQPVEEFAAQVLPLIAANLNLKPTPV